MTIQTKRKPKTRRQPARSAREPAPGADQTAVFGELCVVPLKEIEPSPFQTRRQVDQGQIDALADSIKKHGLLQAAVVREKAGYRSKLHPRFQLVCGERRVRAARAAGLKEIRVDIRRLDDRQCRELILVENLEREDLSAIEEAEGFRQMINAGDAPGPTELARRLGLSQGHVSNRLRLLELPAEWQRRIISHEIPATHARELLAYAKHPKLLQAIGKQIGKKPFVGTVEDFQDEIHLGVEAVTRPMTREVYDPSSGRHVAVFKPSKEQKEQLDLVEVPTWNGRHETRAANTKLFDKLQREHAKKWVAEQEAKGKGGRRAKAAGKSGNGKRRKPTPAQLVRLEKERAEQFQRKLWGWYVDWLRWLIAERIREDASTEELLLILLALAGQWGMDRYLQHRDGSGYRFCGDEWLVDSTRAQESPLGRDRVKALIGLIGSGTAHLHRVAIEAAARCFYGERPIPLVPNNDVLTIAKQFGVDPQSAWLDAQAGPLSEAYWNLHNREQLLELGKELKVDLPAGGKKAALVAALLARKPGPKDKEVGINLPKELKRVKRPK